MKYGHEHYKDRGYARLSAAIVSSAVLEYRNLQKKMENLSVIDVNDENYKKEIESKMNLIKIQMLSPANPAVMYLETVGHELADNLIDTLAEKPIVGEFTMRGKQPRSRKAQEI